MDDNKILFVDLDGTLIKEDLSNLAFMNYLKKKPLNQYLVKRKKDTFFKQSKIQGYRSRSAFKLLELDKKFK